MPRRSTRSDALGIYRLLEEQIVPACYDRGRDRVPARWTAIMKASIARALPRFCARRSVKVFAGGAYGVVVESR
jgi:glycogen phosphorylase